MSFLSQASSDAATVNGASPWDRRKRGRSLARPPSCKGIRRAASVHPVEPPRVVVEDALLHGVRQIGSLDELRNVAHELGALALVGVVGREQKVVGAHPLGYVRE